MRAITISYILSSFLSRLPIKEIHFSARGPYLWHFCMSYDVHDVNENVLGSSFFCTAELNSAKTIYRVTDNCNPSVSTLLEFNLSILSWLTSKSRSLTCTYYFTFLLWSFPHFSTYCIANFYFQISGYKLLQCSKVFFSTADKSE